MATKSATTAAPDEGAFLMHIDDYLPTLATSIRATTGHAHQESIAAYRRLKYAAHELKKTESEWNADFEKFMNSIPS